MPLASVKVRLLPSTITVKSLRTSTETSCALEAVSAVPATGAAVRVPLRVTVLVLSFQSTFLPISSPIARTGR